MRPRSMNDVVVKRKSATAEMSAAKVPARATVRRLARSATCPAYNAMAISGSASASPMSPSESGSRVSAKTCQPTTTICASRATVESE